jgi:hypothetical protein
VLEELEVMGVEIRNELQQQKQDDTIKKQLGKFQKENNQ